MDVERWSAFTTDPSGGNPAGVVIADERPDAATMQRVAADVGYSETAFLVPEDQPGRWWVRYYSPEAEVPFCGHATIASGVALAARDPDLGEAVLASAVGDVRVVLDPSLPPAVGHGGAFHPVLALGDRDVLGAMDYDFDELRALMQREDWTTVQIVWREGRATFHARNPFPVGGVVEDPATGAAAAALGAYLRDRDELPGDGRLTVHQGHDMGRPSVLHVDASGAGGVRVAGTAVALD